MKTSFKLTNKKHLISLVILVAILMITLFSSCYVIEEMDHDCSGTGCHVCAMIELCANNLKQIGIGQITIIIVAATIYCFFSVIYHVLSTVFSETLVNRKVRLND